MKRYKAFKDLEFKPHPLGRGFQATITLCGNDLSVVYGSKSFYCSEGTYETMSPRHGFDRVKGHQTPAQISRHMFYLQTGR